MDRSEQEPGPFFYLRDVEKIAAGIASIGGAGNFDGIVHSGIVAAYLT